MDSCRFVSVRTLIADKREEQGGTWYRIRPNCVDLLRDASRPSSASIVTSVASIPMSATFRNSQRSHRICDD